MAQTIWLPAETDRVSAIGGAADSRVEGAENLNKTPRRRFRI